MTFGAALRLPWAQVRGLVAASVVLSAPTLLATVLHLGVFDFTRWQAWAWVLLFTAAPPFWAGLLLVNGRPGPAPGRQRPGATASGLLAVMGILAVAGVIVWIAPEAGARFVPFVPSPLGGRFLASWFGFFAVLVWWVARRPAEARLCLLALTAYSTGALVAGLRSVADLAPPAARWTYLVVLAGLAAACAVALLRARATSAEPVGPEPAV